MASPLKVININNLAAFTTASSAFQWQSTGMPKAHTDTSP
jgi:hypothetical protein